MVGRFEWVALCVAAVVVQAAEQDEEQGMSLGPLQVEIHVARTAHLFHVVDQLSQWSPFCHGQYLRGLGPLDDEDQALLAEHRAVRAARDWGQGLEQTFYTTQDLPDALAAGIDAGWLTLAEAAVEERVFERFAQRTDALLEAEAQRLMRFEARILAERELLSGYAGRLARLLAADPPPVPIFLLANPSDHEYGGGFNGGRLTLEIPRRDDALGTLVHELFHALLVTRQADIELLLAERTDVELDFQTLNEGLAHAIAPGLVHPGSADDPLVDRVREVERRGVGLEDYQGRVYRYALALRPLLREALAEDAPDAERAPLDFEQLLTRALDVWQALVELELARELR